MKTWKLFLHAYLYGTATMFAFMILLTVFDNSPWNLLYWLQAIVTVPVTPVGLPFFIGSIYGCKKYFDKLSQKG